MNEYLYWDLGNQRQGAAVVTDWKGNAANIRLLDSSNYRLYFLGETFSFYGPGLASASPVCVEVPYDAYWYAVVDLS